MTCVVLDNGAGAVKFGCAGEESPMGSVPNCTARVDKEMKVFVGDEVDSVFNGTTLHFSRPFDRGFLTNWQCELEVWQRLFSSNHLSINTETSSLIVTSPPFTPETLQNDMNEVVFEDFRFTSYLRRPASWFSAYSYATNLEHSNSYRSCCLVVDSGFSFTHIMPFISQKCLRQGCKRVNVGGKLLTNYLKEVVSFRQFNMMDEFRLMDQVKRELCFVSPDLQRHLSQMQKTARSRSDVGVFVLPDYQKLFTGYVLTEEAERDIFVNKNSDGQNNGQDLQHLVLDVERAVVPEILFRPQDSNVGLPQAGVVEATWQSLRALGQVEMGLVASNVLLTGGNVQFPGFQERFYQDFRPFVPDIFEVNVFIPEDPDLYAWRGASKYSMSEDCSRSMVTRKEYLENGHFYCNKKLDSSW